MNKIFLRYIIVVVLSALAVGCNIPTTVQKTENKSVSSSYVGSLDTLNSAKLDWRDFFGDSYLTALIDTALQNNQELNIVLQEIAIANNEIMARKGEYLPFMNVGGAAGAEHVARYTRSGSVEANNEIKPGKEFPDPLPDFMMGFNAWWEVDIWNKLHNAKKAAALRYLSTIEGRNFIITQLISEIANSYYELLALDNELNIVRQNLEIQMNALEVVRLEKIAARTTELAVTRFEAEVLKNQSRQFYIQQSIIETENRINFLVGRFPRPIARNAERFNERVPQVVYSGIPSQLLDNRPDVRQAQLQLAASKLDVKATRANFYPSLRITAGVGYQAFNPSLIVRSPESMMYSLAGDLMAPLINRNAIKAMYLNASAAQVQAVFNFERSLMRAHIEVVNQLSRINNLQRSYDLKSQQVQALTESIAISTRLFRSARADYMEVLLTQRDALESKMELIENKKLQMNAMVDLYQALGGGWR